MKKFVIVLVLFSLVLPVFAQNNSGNDENLYYFNVTVERVYPSSQGYLVQYRSGVNSISTIGIPTEWFTEAGGKAGIIKLVRASDWPSMSVFYRDGQFSHVRLYVHPVRAHWTWGNLPQGTDISRYFMDTDSFMLEF